MDTHNKNTDREDRPRDINPEEAGLVHPAKETKAQEKIQIKESGHGRDQGQIPADEHIEYLSQVDEATINMQNNSKAMPGENGFLDKQSENQAYADEVNSNDNRDHNDSTTDWNAENNETGRHK